MSLLLILSCAKITSFLKRDSKRIASIIIVEVSQSYILCNLFYKYIKNNDIYVVEHVVFYKLFYFMKFHREIFRYKVAVGIVLKQLRREILIDGKPMTQEFLNNDISEKYNKSWNSAREETLPNTTLENLYLISDYFKIDIDYFFQLVKKITKKEIDDTIERKIRLNNLYKELQS
ncbi:hypothetical protein SDC9_147633 [bioreactor metagenome]|uniref:HTH cro/C1-type domain-containing protein n=1 Tax=bioreactor metagenome TaxID=1076179 RepID=A0A645EEK3_9ZZZZ